MEKVKNTVIKDWPKEQSLINNLVDLHKIINKSYIRDSPHLSRERPFGSKCLIIRNNVQLAAFEMFNDLKLTSIIKVVIGADKFVYIFGAWIPFDDGTI